MSARVQDLLRQFDFALKAYSIDECFLRLAEGPDIPALAAEIKRRM